MKKTAWTSVALMFFFAFCGPIENASAQASRGMGIPPEKLPKELREISPRDYFIPSPQKNVGVIHALEGTVVVLHGQTGEAYYGMAGDVVYEKDSLITLPESKCRIRFVDEDIVTMAPGTQFSVESFEDQRAQGTKSSFFRMVKGKAMFYALRLFRYRDTRFSLATPTTTIGVRGTKFGAHVYYLNEAKTADLGILVADGGNEIAPYLLAQTGMGQSFTNCFAEDGVVNVNGINVGPGQMYNGQTGQVIPTPPNVIQSFRLDTTITTGGGTSGQGSTGGGQEPPPPPPPPGAQTTTGPAAADILGNITSNMQVQNTQQVLENQSTGIKSLPGPLYGYFSLMLRRNGSLYDAFLVSQTSPPLTEFPPRTDPHDTNVQAQLNGLVNTSDYIKMNNPSGEPDSGVAKLGGAVAEDSGGSFNAAWTKTYVGQGTYTQWGYWETASSTQFDSNGANNEFIANRVWFMEGNSISKQADIASVPTGTYTYTGKAHGTYFAPGVNAILSGSFTGKVNFPAGTIQEVNINASDAGGVHSVSMQQISPQTIITNSSGNHFNLDYTYLDAKIDGVSTANTRSAVNGSLYGPKAEEIGGNWGVVDTSLGKGATGIFQGKR